MTKEEWRWRIIEAYKEDMNASYNKIADKAHVSFARVKRWLPVYQRTGCVFDDTKPGPVPTHPMAHNGAETPEANPKLTL